MIHGGKILSVTKGPKNAEQGERSCGKGGHTKRDYNLETAYLLITKKTGLK